jgi:hypothetical protein
MESARSRDPCAVEEELALEAAGRTPRGGELFVGKITARISYPPEVGRGIGQVALEADAREALRARGLTAAHIISHRLPDGGVESIVRHERDDEPAKPAS